MMYCIHPCIQNTVFPNLLIASNPTSHIFFSTFHNSTTVWTWNGNNRHKENSSVYCRQCWRNFIPKLLVKIIIIIIMVSTLFLNIIKYYLRKSVHRFPPPYNVPTVLYYYAPSPRNDTKLIEKINYIFDNDFFVLNNRDIYLFDNFEYQEKNNQRFNIELDSTCWQT